MFGVFAVVAANVPVQVVSPCPYHGQTVDGGAPICASRIPKQTPLFDILAAAHVSAVGQAPVAVASPQT